MIAKSVKVLGYKLNDDKLIAHVETSKNAKITTFSCFDHLINKGDNE
jgi:hypothetical protein